jgi:hypothetical protein
VAAAVIVVAVRTRLLTASSGRSRHRSVSGNSASALITAARSFLSRWIDQQASQRGAYGHQSMDSQQAAAARALAGNPDEEPA